MLRIVKLNYSDEKLEAGKRKIEFLLLDWRRNFDLEIALPYVMEKKTRSRLINILFVIAIVLMIIPQTRTPIQVFLHKGLSLFGPSIIDESERESISFENWQLQGLDGEIVNLKDFEGEVTLLNFWATWCPPCIAEMPSLQELYNEYSGKVNIVLISNEEPQVVDRFLLKNNYEFNVYRPMGSYPNSFQISSIPRTFILSNTGEIVVDKKGSANWNSEKVRALLDILLTE